MFVAFFFLGYLLLALAIPLGWSLIPLWLRAHPARRVRCPEEADAALVQLDAWFAVKMHAVGDRGLRVKGCSRWPQRGDCGQHCLADIAS